MVEAERGSQPESDVLTRQLDAYLAGLRADHGRADVILAVQVAEALRKLVAETAFASAVDRARVRAAVHYFVLRRDGRGERRPARALTEDVRVVDEIVRMLGRSGLEIVATPDPPAAAGPVQEVAA